MTKAEYEAMRPGVTHARERVTKLRALVDRGATPSERAAARNAWLEARIEYLELKIAVVSAWCTLHIQEHS